MFNEKQKKKAKKAHPTSGLKEIFMGTLGKRQKAFLLKHNERGNLIHMIHHTASSFLFLAAPSEDVFYLHIILADTSHNPLKLSTYLSTVSLMKMPPISQQGRCHLLLLPP